MEGHNDSKCDKNPSMGFLRIGKKQFRSLSPSKGTFPKKKLDFWQTACYIIKESGVYRFRQTGVILCCR